MSGFSETTVEDAPLDWLASLGVVCRPIEEGLLTVACINRVILGTVIYSVHFGTVMDAA